jgi:hypothetical protein
MPESIVIAPRTETNTAILGHIHAAGFRARLTE